MSGISRITLQPAYLLHRRPYRETSLLLYAFAANHGKIALIAKGARRPKSKIGGILQPFNLLNLSWIGKSELFTLTDAELAVAGAGLAASNLYCGFYLNELIDRFLGSHDPHPRLFEQYAHCLHNLQANRTNPPGADLPPPSLGAAPAGPAWLSQSAPGGLVDAHSAPEGGASGMACINVEASLRLFEYRLLNETGYGLQLDHEAKSGAPLDPDSYYRYYVEEGPVEAEKGENSIRGATLIGLRENKLETASALREAKRLMRRIIDHHLDGRPLKSRALFKRTTAL